MFFLFLLITHGKAVKFPGRVEFFLLQICCKSQSHNFPFFLLAKFIKQPEITWEFSVGEKFLLEHAVKKSSRISEKVSIKIL